MALALVDTKTGEILEHEVLLVGRKPKYVDKGFIKVFVAFLEDVVADKEVSGKAIRLLLYMLERLDFNNLTVYLNPKDACRELGIARQTLYNWLSLLIRKKYVEKVDTRLYKIKAYSAVKGNMGKTIENSINKRLMKRKYDLYVAVSQGSQGEQESRLK